MERHTRVLRRPAAVKLISGSQLAGADQRETALRRFEREAHVTATLRCPNTVQLYDFGVSTAGDIYYVMELLDGVERIKSNGYGYYDKPTPPHSTQLHPR